MTFVLDDHLLRDWMARRDEALEAAIADQSLATTNLWYARLCKSAASVSVGAGRGRWSVDQRRVLVARLVDLPDEVAVVPMRQLAWRMGELIAGYNGLSMLGAEAVAAAIALEGHLLVSARDDGPGIQRCCAAVGVGYDALPR